MILSDRTIRTLLASGQMVIEPMEEVQVRPASVDVRLGNTFATALCPPGGAVRMDEALSYQSEVADTYTLQPGQFVLATTMEYIRMPNNMTAFVEGRSSIGRMGLFVENAGWVDPGFEGEITLELFNAGNSPIVLQAGRRVGQLVFAQLDRDAQNPYQGKYSGQRGATGSRIHLDEEI